MQIRLNDVLNNQGDNYILPFYWQHGEDAELLAEGMERIRECGIKAVCIEARPHPDFVGKLWWRDMDIIMQKARELGMKVWVLDDSHFPTGRCNDKITADSPYRKILLTHYSIEAVGPMKEASFMVNLEKNETFIGAVAAKMQEGGEYILTEVQDISHCYYGDVIEWDVPEGFYSITIIKTTDKHTARQGYANLIDRDAVRFFLDTVYEPHYKYYGKEFGTVFAGFFSDEPQLGNTFKDIPEPGNSYAGVPNIPLPWCKELEEKLHQLWGEEYCRKLCALWYHMDNNPETTNETGKIRREYTDLVTRLYQKNFGEQIGDWCRAHGVEYIGHIIEECRLGVGVGHYFRGLWGQDMSGIDVVLQSIRPELDKLCFHSIGGLDIRDGEFPHYGLAKLGASLSHIDPKKKGRALCENFGAYGWTEGVKLMKWLTDHMLVRGINYYVPHGFTMRDFPDPDCPPHFYARGNNPQFPYFGLLMKYLNRVSHLINGGVHCTKVGILYSDDLEWMDRKTMQFYEPARVLTQNQIDFDILPIDVVTESKIENGFLYSGAPVYEDGNFVGQENITTLVIPECRCLTRKFADWCKKTMKEKVRIICLNSLPRILDEDGKLNGWGAHCPEVMSLDELGDKLRQSKVGLELSVTDPYLRYYHYAHTDGAYYLFFNESVNSEIRTEIGLEVGKGENVAEYNAWENRLENAAWNQEKGILSLKLLPYEMKIITIAKINKELIHTKVAFNDEKIEINPEWSLYLKKTKETEFHFDRQLTKLTNITRYDVDPHFCGTMKYVTELTCDLGKNLTAIDFGQVYETAQLRINGKMAGVRISPPYQFDLRGLLKEGKNTMELEVTNTVVHQIRDHFSMSMTIEPSGLLGPVVLLSDGASVEKDQTGQ
ncbi:hypothetical protein [Clostridium grantii]|uniref:Alpha-L-rhamnosidase n=1 Tax=Clostridium grantii DSM 8605 TaxID=1121316 RepID=A0A1M5SV08_9CLOT|nr:hypothetical protein [Clostridium grantii]SHH42270.1 hypothetical protein SAMN02745207_01046 [Clostridium grantii DSM 8605]